MDAVLHTVHCTLREYIRRVEMGIGNWELNLNPKSHRSVTSLVSGQRASKGYISSITQQKAKSMF